MSDAPVRHYQPRALLFRTLAWLWIFPTVGALVILLRGFQQWPQVHGLRAALEALTFEQWCAIAVLLVHVAFVILAARLRKTEPFREVPPDDPI